MREKDEKRSLPIILFVATALTCLFVALCAFNYIAESRRYRATSPELINAWYGESNNVITFASDGTGLGVIDNQAPQFFRWSESNRTLRIYYEPRRKPLIMIAHQFVAELAGTQASVPESYRIESLTRDSMTLQDLKTGNKVHFHTTKPTPK